MSLCVVIEKLIFFSVIFALNYCTFRIYLKIEPVNICLQHRHPAEVFFFIFRNENRLVLRLASVVKIEKSQKKIKSIFLSCFSSNCFFRSLHHFIGRSVISFVIVRKSLLRLCFCSFIARV